MPDISTEIKFKTARSGGKGGQNVNKVESMVSGYWNVDASTLFNPDQKELIKKKLALNITIAGELLAKSQTDRSQLANKLIVVKRMNSLIGKALIQPKKRNPTKPSKGSVVKRLESKKKAGDIKLGRKKINKDA